MSEGDKIGLGGAIAESSDNKTYTDNIKKLLALFDLVDGFIENLTSDKDGVISYLENLHLLKGRGFKVENAIARLEYQLQQTKVSITSFTEQKGSRLKLLAIDIIDIAENVLARRLIIDDKQQALIDEMRNNLKAFRDKVNYNNSEISKLVTLSLSHMSDLNSDIGKFDAQIAEAKIFSSRNYDIGDLIGDLINQKNTLKASYDQFLINFANLSLKHHLRSERFIDELKEASKRIKDAPKADEDAPKITTVEEAQSNKPKKNTNESQSNEPQSNESQSNESQSNESQSNESQSNEPQSNEPESNE